MASFAEASRITPFLWFDSNAEEAVDFYLSIFKNSRRFGEFRPRNGAPQTPQDKPLTIAFELEGIRFTALNGGPHHQFTDAVSFVVRCDSQAELDEYWAKLSADGGTEVACGWLRDKFGLSWQVVPARLPELLQHHRAFQALLKMKKIEIAELERAGKD